jgi:tetratricopeptide (TPR) repeat protein
MTQLASIYVLCGDRSKHQRWASNYKKVRGVFIEIVALCDQLKIDVRLSENALTSMSIVSSPSTTDLNQLDSSFMYSQLLKEILLEHEPDPEEKKQLVDFCRLHYAKNDAELAVITEFERDFPRPSAIWWYSRDCFVYPMLNKALRTQDVEVIMKMGFVVRDLHRHIELLHEQRKDQRPLILYRGQGMFEEEFDKINNSRGALLAFNNFLSTSTNRQVSYLFAESATQNPDLIGILFRINIDPKLSTTPFAELDNVSYFGNTEEEILFSMHTVFRIGQTTKIEQRFFQIDLELTNDNDQQLTTLTQHMREATRGPTGIHRMGQLMCHMGEVDKAEEIYITLIETTADDDRKELAHLHHQVGFIKSKKGDLLRALSHYQQSLEIELTYLSSDHPRLSNTYSNIGLVLQKQGDLDSALKHLKRALNMALHAQQPDQISIATLHNNIGSVLEEQGKYGEALKSFERALEIRFVHLPPRHSSLAITYNSIGMLHREMGDHSNALSYLKKTLEIEEGSLPPHHQWLSITHNNLSYVLYDLHRTREAIEHAERAVEIGRRSLGSQHPSVQQDQQHLDELRQKV